MKKVLLLLLIPTQIFAQQFAKDLQKQLDTYYQSYIPLKVHVFTNQPEYAAGDTIYFKVNLVTAQGHRPVGGKSILSAALLNAKDEKILVNGFSAMDGYASNQIILPANLPPGNYNLTVWSDWMVDNKSLLYKKLISVGSPNVPVAKRLFASPEGGNLINGLNTRVVLTGKPFAIGRVNENGTEISKFTIGADGTSSFYLTPKKDFRYEIVSGGDHFSLPEVMNDGIGILVTPLPAKNSLRVYLTTPERSDYRNKTLHLVISMQGIIYQAIDILFKNQSFITLEIPMQRLPQGIAQITLLDDQRNVIVERLCYNPSVQAIATSLGFPKKQFKTRERIDLRLKTVEGSVPAKAKITLTSFNTSLTPLDTSSRRSSLDTDLFLLGDAGFDSFPVSNKDDVATIDNKLILAKWSRFDWRNLAKRSDHNYYSQYMRFKGKAVDIETNKPVPDSTRVTFFLHKNVNTYQAITNDAGEFSLSMLFEFYDTDEVYYRVERKGKLLPNARVSIYQDRLESYESINPEKNKTSYLTLFDKRKMINESYAYHANASRSFVQKDTLSLLEDEIFGPDVTIKMEDYHLFPTMIETLREVIPFSQHRKIRGKDVVRIFNFETKDYWWADPVYVIDGVMTDDTDYFLSLNPADIVAIKLVHMADKLRTFGTIGAGGMFLVETKIPDNYKNVHRSVRTFTLTGLNAPLRRGAVSHQVNPASRTPDLRTNLAWVPLINTNSNGEAEVSFYASDVPGKYRIEGEGISSDGKLFSFEDEFEVIFEK